MSTDELNHFDSVATPESVVRFLNSLLEIDRDAISGVFLGHVPCNKGLSDHRTVQVLNIKGITSVGPLGILNGIFGVNNAGYGCIFAITSDDGKYIKEFIVDKLAGLTPPFGPGHTNLGEKK